MSTILISKVGNFMVHIDKVPSSKSDGFLFKVLETGFISKFYAKAEENARDYLKSKRNKLEKKFEKKSLNTKKHRYYGR